MKMSQIKKCLIFPKDFECLDWSDLPEPSDCSKPKTFAEFENPIERIKGREILDVCEYMGTYGMGGAGFFGLCLKETEQYPMEWIVLTLWGASSWMLFNGNVIGVWGKQLEEYPNHVEGKEEYPKFIGKKIDKATMDDDSFEFKIGEDILSLSKNPKERPYFPGTGRNRVLEEGDTMWKAWIITEIPMILV